MNLFHDKRTFESQLDKIIKMQIRKNLTKEQKQDIGLEKLFYYFTKQQRAIGLNPNFEKLEAVDKEMSLNNFMIFCQKYNIIYNQITNKTGMKALLLQTIFKTFAHHGLRMDYNAFKKCINYVAIKYYQKREIKKLKPQKFWKAPRKFVKSKEDKVERIRNKFTKIQEKDDDILELDTYVQDYRL